MHRNMLILLFKNKWLGSLFYISLLITITSNVIGYKEYFITNFIFSFLIVFLYMFMMYQYDKTYIKYYQKKEV